MEIKVLLALEHRTHRNAVGVSGFIHGGKNGIVGILDDAERIGEGKLAVAPAHGALRPAVFLEKN